MMQLPIYGRGDDGRKTIVKTYKAEGYDLMWGVVEDIANAFRLDDMKQVTPEQLQQQLGAYIVSHLPDVHDFLKDIFEGITDEEIRSTRAEDVIMVFVDLAIYTITNVSKSFAWGDSKNLEADGDVR